jgi:hypothetical protein
VEEKKMETKLRSQNCTVSDSLEDLEAGGKIIPV